jgi:hypothetical protein
MEVSESLVKFLQKFEKREDLIENVFLNSLIESYSKIKDIDKIQDLSEPQIRNKFQHDLIYSNALIKDLIKENIITFTVENQIINKDNELMRTDIEFIINGVVRFVVECKKIRTANKSQYIDKGISRFILSEKYTNKNDKYAGMCSFIFQSDVNKLINGIKEKIKQYKLIKLDNNIICNFQYSFRSKHNKMDNTDILIYHLFFEMKKN